MQPIDIAKWSEVPDREASGRRSGPSAQASILRGIGGVDASTAPAMGYFHLSEFDTGDLTTSDCEMVHLTGIGSGGVKLGAY